MKKIEEHKPLSFSTTMRNPERISEFIACMKDFEGHILTDELIMQIVRKVIKNKLYKPNYIKENPTINNIYSDESRTFSNDQLDDIVKNSPQNHKEAGFTKGWPSRFDTWYKLCKEFGFIYYDMGKKIEISSSGHMLCDAYLLNSKYEDLNNSGKKIQKIFLNALVKYQTNNPFRRNLNQNAPIPLLLNVLNLLALNSYSTGLHRKEIPFLMCWENNDYKQLYEFIINFRNKYGFKASDEIIYEECLRLLKSSNKKRFKMSQIIKEGVDDFIRKLRITGIFSLRGLGRFVDINKLELESVDYIIKNYTKYNTLSNKYDFYKYMSEIDAKFLEFKEIVANPEINDIRVKTLRKISQKYSVEQIHKELRNLQLNKNSEDEYFKLIDSPTRLEFLTSIAIIQKFPQYEIHPNYSIDDEGNPTFTAKGGVADIEIYDTNLNSIVEVTLMKSRQQAANEIPAITRHLKKQRDEYGNNNVFSLFVAPNIHEDTLYMCHFTMYKEKLGIYPYTIVDFVQKIQTTNSLLELEYEI
ncbi:Putative restriction endonuclease [Mycoplasma mycoides subsp. capri LC str. 95010]|uniref:Putative restriction endonuclease n=1 Tax=Mycoplasma mycoides subsp. capri LC str. 95010 TaxID=862259 RepID=F4MNY8_MYCML|nr:AlwI family type II restriction endonuclease [Mycoplasma mycoides]CBW53820.1 Putative restriction endonuclease [Mycoplasma mycoides subsp. capri LC str. 95010]